MPYKILVTILFLFCLVTAGSAANTNKAPQNLQQEIPAEPLPATEKQVSKVTVKDNLLSVEFYDASFGEAIQTIGSKAGFLVEGSSKAFNKKVTVKFRNMEIDNGIMRLFSLVKESNYIINYNNMGSISRLRVSAVREAAEDRAVGNLKKAGIPEITKPRGRRVLRPINPAVEKDPSL